MAHAPPPRSVLITNDDGPPGSESPFIGPFIEELRNKFGWKLKVCLPASQKSWIGKGFLIREEAPVYFYDPKTGHVEDHPQLSDGRAPDAKEGRWTLVEATPSACVNIGLNHLFNADEIDLVLSGPNFGRNSGSAMSFSSGTVGAALEGTLLSKRAISLSIAFYSREFPEPAVRCAVETAAEVVHKLWSNWPQDKRVDLFNVNIPLVPQTPSVHLTRMSRGRYTSLYKPVPSAPVTPDEATPGPTPSSGPLLFRWQPTFKPPTGVGTSEDAGTDMEALNKFCGSVTPLSCNMECPWADKLGAASGTWDGFTDLMTIFPPVHQP
ncbi:sure-like protein [Gonapodya prolifera JEL478]|uniref:Sure-like protein n=1 Tax=Gonapodya prolifera (strain JEL478) TaxID=1344416 RepID=A0A139AVS0_GONPJ|nr:sure-like protein [Gonapodya prolifera JEL478]|eukprot:KXS20794.1 sure-like protein [Gonapodya prolifera JEL478]